MLILSILRWSINGQLNTPKECCGLTIPTSTTAVAATVAAEAAAATRAVTVAAEATATRAVTVTAEATATRAVAATTILPRGWGLAARPALVIVSARRLSRLPAVTAEATTPVTVSAAAAVAATVAEATATATRAVTAVPVAAAAGWAEADLRRLTCGRATPHVVFVGTAGRVVPASATRAAVLAPALVLTGEVDAHTAG